ncbi:hypothetical protein MESS2_1270022 [Mesorhizobium metallidurans STM 2683]|uniref:Uncharacterized protein n=1 Tax=Mesorhizobium metallidurans STM 2683 TaxID=1297569 RepID=M5EIZ4_9HYPH|nr:hypothetical protein MESS2_1270022 [Mesorhizobium metallidurans STM 2683]
MDNMSDGPRLARQVIVFVPVAVLKPLWGDVLKAPPAGAGGAPWTVYRGRTVQ